MQLWKIVRLCKSPEPARPVHKKNAAASGYNENNIPCGGMGERFIPAVLKTVVPEKVPGVRIPLPPPNYIRRHPINFSESLIPYV